MLVFLGSMLLSSNHVLSSSCSIRTFLMIGPFSWSISKSQNITFSQKIGQKVMFEHHPFRSSQLSYNLVATWISPNLRDSRDACQVTSHPLEFLPATRGEENLNFEIARRWNGSLSKLLDGDGWVDPWKPALKFNIDTKHSHMSKGEIFS